MEVREVEGPREGDLTKGEQQTNGRSKPAEAAE